MIYAALFCTTLFVIQFLLSLVFDTDIDFEGYDLDPSGILSFKGLLHFGIGFFWGMWFTGDNWILSVCLGMLMAIILSLVYWGALKLKKEVIPEKGEDLLGRTIEIYYKGPGFSEWIVFVRINGERREISVTSESGVEYQVGDKNKITKYVDGEYWIP